MSLGHHLRCGTQPANSIACWPVPLPSSSTSPDCANRKPEIADQIGSWLRLKAGPLSRPSAADGSVFLPYSTTNMTIVVAAKSSAENAIRHDRQPWSKAASVAAVAGTNLDPFVVFTDAIRQNQTFQRYGAGRRGIPRERKNLGG